MLSIYGELLSQKNIFGKFFHFEIDAEGISFFMAGGQEVKRLKCFSCRTKCDTLKLAIIFRSSSSPSFRNFVDEKTNIFTRKMTTNRENVYFPFSNFNWCKLKSSSNDIRSFGPNTNSLFLNVRLSQHFSLANEINEKLSWRRENRQLIAIFTHILFLDARWAAFDKAFDCFRFM